MPLHWAYTDWQNKKVSSGGFPFTTACDEDDEADEAQLLSAAGFCVRARA